MNRLEIGLLVVGISLVLVLFTYLGLTTILRMEKVLPRWAKENGLRIVHKDARTFFQGPFIQSSWRPVYYITIEDQEHKQKSGWVRLGWWYMVGFKEHIEVRWED